MLLRGLGLRAVLPLLLLVPSTVSPMLASPASAFSNGVLTSDDRTLHAGVGTYTDCSGRTPLQNGEAAIDTCIRGRHYFLGHNYGVFTPLLHMQPGDQSRWSRPLARPGQLPIHIDPPACARTNGTQRR